MSIDAAERVADAILYEGYVLYPYRASAAKNQIRWQFGIVAPRDTRDDGEPWFSQTECLIQPSAANVRVSARIRCLRAHTRPASAWLEAAPFTFAIDDIPLGALPLSRDVPIEGVGLNACARIEAEAVDRFIRLRLRVENLEPWTAAFADNRDALLLRSLVAAHSLLTIQGGSFVSLLEPDESAAPLVSTCRNWHTWPVLVGDRARRDQMLSSPIVLYDYPAIAPESPTPLCDGTEIDEILALRIMTLTDAEKAEARRTDPRSRRIIDDVDALTPDAFERLHGTMRDADFFNPPGAPPPDQASVLVDGVRVTKGTHVRIHPSRRADAMDMFLRDQLATVAGVYRDVDERVHIAVTIDADPAAALHESFGRYFYFDPSEVEPM